MTSTDARLRMRHDASRSENLALLLGACAAVVGGVCGVLALDGTKPLFGRGSIGEVSAWAAMATSGIAFLVAARLIVLDAQPWMRTLPWWRRWSNLLGLAALHAVFAFLLTSVLFGVFSQAFRGLELDHWAGTFWVAAACGACAYICGVSAAELTTRSLSALLTAFLVTGVMVSAMSSPDPEWWRYHFSILGAENGEASIAFNLTLLLAGFALVTIGDFLGHDISAWAAATDEPRWKVRAVRVAMFLLGALLTLVALIPVNVEKAWHDTAAQGIVVVFAVVLVAFPLMFPGLPGGFRPVTIAVLALLMLCLFLWKGLGYLNATAFEMGAATIVFVWLLLFVRSVTAAVQSLPTAGVPREVEERSTIER